MQTDCFPHALEAWEKSPICVLAEVNPRYPVRKGREYPFIEMASVGENFGGILKIETRKMEGSGLSRFKVGDTLFAKITPCPENGKIAFVNELPADFGLGSTEFIVLAPRNGCVPRFLYYLLCCHEIRGRAVARMEGSTGRQRVPDDVFEKWLLVPIPPPHEQTAIARILDAMDTTIERTREAVERAEVLKLALMQAAFSFEMTNESHKSSDAGHIPESWQAIKGKQAFTVLSGGNSSVFALKPLREEVEADAWFMKVDDFNLPENSRRIVKTQIGFRATDNLDFRLVPIDTLVIAKRGAAILKNRVRTTAVPVALDPNLMGLQMQAEIIPEFFRYQLEWRNLSRYIESSGVPQLNNKDLYPRWFFKPPEDQQKEIVSVIAATETYQDALLRKLNVIEQLKKSLMHDLLTGKVRINPSHLLSHYVGEP